MAALLEAVRPSALMTATNAARRACVSCLEMEGGERRKHAAVERSGEGGAAGVGDLGIVEVEHLEFG